MFPGFAEQRLRLRYWGDEAGAVVAVVVPGYPAFRATTEKSTSSSAGQVFAEEQILLVPDKLAGDWFALVVQNGDPGIQVVAFAEGKFGINVGQGHRDFERVVALVDAAHGLESDEVGYVPDLVQTLAVGDVMGTYLGNNGAPEGSEEEVGVSDYNPGRQFPIR